MKWYYWALIAIAVILIIVFAVRAQNKKALASQTASNSGFNPYNIIPIPVTT